MARKTKAVTFVLPFSHLCLQLPVGTDLGKQTLFLLEIHFERCWKKRKYIFSHCFFFQECGEQCASERNFLLKSSGRHCALPVAYLSNVTPHVSRCLKKTPASAFTPISHSHISFPRPLRLPFHFLLHCRYCKVKMVCYLFIYENCSEGNVFTIATDLCVFWRSL